MKQKTLLIIVTVNIFCYELKMNIFQSILVQRYFQNILNNYENI